MMSNILSVKRNMCFGCTACASICAIGCISMEYNAEGFLYPKINEERCIHCGACINHCPAIRPAILHKTLQAFAAVCLDNELYHNSSSGGLFPTVAKYIIDELEGYVCAATMDDDLSVRHTIINSVDEIRNLQGSKYVQSDVGSIYDQIKLLLDQGKFIMFCGTPCQVAGLLNTLKAPQPRLLTIDLICHGTPSPIFFKKHIINTYGDDVRQVLFRLKSKNETTSFSLKIIRFNGKQRIVPGFKDAYYHLFLKGISYRESCYKCPYAYPDRTGDITIGDCASAKEYEQKLPYLKMFSSVLVNTEKGRMIWERIKEKTTYCKLLLNKEIELNKQLHIPNSRPMERDNLYSVIFTGGYDQKALSKFMKRIPLQERLLEWVRRNTPVIWRKRIKGIILRQPANRVSAEQAKE